VSQVRILLGALVYGLVIGKFARNSDHQDDGVTSAVTRDATLHWWRRPRASGGSGSAAVLTSCRRAPFASASTPGWTRSRSGGSSSARSCQRGRVLVIKPRRFEPGYSARLTNDEAHEPAQRSAICSTDGCKSSTSTRQQRAATSRRSASASGRCSARCRWPGSMSKLSTRSTPSYAAAETTAAAGRTSSTAPMASMSATSNAEYPARRLTRAAADRAPGLQAPRLPRVVGLDGTRRALDRSSAGLSIEPSCGTGTRPNVPALVLPGSRDPGRGY
jgi:hypothetical protein